MPISINKDTKLCCSFAKEAGSRGCLIHNLAFQYLKLNYVYKSFSVDDIGRAMDAVRTLSIRGAAVTMPYKIKVIEYLDVLDSIAKRIGVVNTVVNDGSQLIGYNTDYAALMVVCQRYYTTQPVFVLGSGGMARTCHQVLIDLNFTNFGYIAREDWGRIDFQRNSLFINCTPAKVKPHASNEIVDCSVESETGKEIGLLQAAEQFRLYTGELFPMEYLGGILHGI